MKVQSRVTFKVFMFSRGFKIFILKEGLSLIRLRGIQRLEKKIFFFNKKKIL